MAVKTTQIDGDLSLGRNIAMGGKANVAGSMEVGHGLTVKGWLDAPNIKGSNKGVFASLSALQTAYPEPQDGWLAGIGDSTPFTAYTGQNGSWVATGGTIDINVDMTQYTEDLEAHSEQISEIEDQISTLEDGTTLGQDGQGNNVKPSDIFENKALNEFVRVETDSDGYILEATRPDGTKYFPKDVEAPNITRAVEAIDSLAEAAESTEGHLALGEVDGETQYPSDVYGFLDTSEFIKLNLDMNDRVLSGIRKDGSYYFSKLTADHLEMSRSMLNDFVNGAKDYNLSLMDSNIAESLESEENTEYLHVLKDAEGRVIAAIGQDGSYIISKLLARTIKLDYNALKQLEQMLSDDGFSPNISQLEEAIENNSSAITELSGRVADLTTQVETSESTILSSATTLVNQKTTNIEYSQLSQSCKDAISGSQGGTITNNVDGEDLTTTEGAIHFKNRSTDDGGMAYVILRKNIDTTPSSPTYGKNILTPSLLNNKSNTIFVIQYDFDLYGQTITLGNNVILRFNGGSFKNTKQTENNEVAWATIKLSSTTTIEAGYWCFENCKFDKVSASNRYTKKFDLGWIGIQDDGLDKYTLLSNLYTIFSGMLTGREVTYGKPNFTISGKILCNTNGIYIPTSMNLYGENEAVIQFSSEQGTYCVCVSKLTSIHNVKFKHQHRTHVSGETYANYFSGAIVTIDSRLYNKNIALEPDGSTIFENVSIEGTYGVETNCTGLAIIASDEMYNSEEPNQNDISTFFHQIQIGIINIRYTKIGLKIGLEKTYSGVPNLLVWGNGVVIDQAYIEATDKCVYAYFTSTTTGETSPYGHCRIGWLTGQARKTTCEVVSIDNFNDFRIDNFMPYDTTPDSEGKAPVAFVRGGGVLKIVFDKALATTGATERALLGYKALGLDDNTEYRLYPNSTLCRNGQIYRYGEL